MKVFYKVLFTGIFLTSALSFCAVAKSEVLAPAVQFDTKGYENYFKKSTDHKVDLKSMSDYKITCEADIIGITWGDKRNIKVFDEKNETGEIIDMKSTVLKLKYETYTYLRLYKASREIENILLSVNPLFDDDKVISLGTCTIEPYRE